VRILEVITDPQHGTDSILQATDWTKTWLDWVNMLPLLQAQLPPDRVSKEQPTLQQVKAKLDAWRRANPSKYPNDAWTELGGKGPAPTPNEKMKGRDLRTNPPDDSGTWVELGNYWSHTIPPFIHAIKPNPNNKATWGPSGAAESYIPIDQQIEKIRQGLETAIKNDPTFQEKLNGETKGMGKSEARRYREEMTDQRLNQQIENALRAIPGTTPGSRMYSDREINDGMRNYISGFNFTRALHLHRLSKQSKAEEAAYKAAQDYYSKHDNKCPDGWKRNDKNTACERDFSKPPEPDEEGNCPFGWRYDAVSKGCIKDETVAQDPAVIPPAPVNNNDPTKPDKDGKCTTPGYELSQDGKTCIKKATAPQNTENQNKTIKWPLPGYQKITGPFDPPHMGVDIGTAPKYGVPVIAPEDGTVTERKIEEETPNNKRAAGLYMKFLSTDRNREHIFMHLSKSNPVGRSFKQGETICWTGGVPMDLKDDSGKIILPKDQDTRPGSSTGLHLHWGVAVKGQLVDPLTLPELQK